MMSPLQYYQQQIELGAIREDAAQREVLLLIDKLYRELKSEHSLVSTIKSTLLRLMGLNSAGIKGMYLWGGVGRGKTYMMDILYNLYPYDDKVRLHFHRFMQYVHQMLNQYQGKKNPLRKVAQTFSKQFKLLCFDEFFVSDIADAMCLAKLLKYMMDYGITVVATSNLHPDELYSNGLQRDKFLPAIALIHQRMNVVRILGEHDWRLEQLATLKLYHYPLTEESDNSMQRSFELLAGRNARKNVTITVMSRHILCRYLCEGIVWFDSKVLLESARSASDYIEIARTYHTVFLSDVTIMSENKEDAARRFVSLIDIFYEFHVTLIMSAEVPWEKLYSGRRHRFEFDRTISRLTQMQSQAYLGLPHLG